MGATSFCCDGTKKCHAADSKTAVILKAEIPEIEFDQFDI
jgi:hypothetical protein